ncbi:MAG: energy transducer TonB [Bacteroidetes bacterium]|nr:energy transducer TonB [Bacteroidota bacterium]
MIPCKTSFFTPAKGNPFGAVNLIIALMIFFAGNIFSMKCVAQYNQYNQYESQAGTPALAPPRHHNPPKDEEVKDNDKTFKKIDKQPEFPGGTETLFRFLRQNIKYPPKAVSMKLEGKVFVGFTVKADGSVDNVEAMRGIGGGCDEEAVRVVKLMPKWKPGEVKGKSIDVSMVLPVKFPPDTLSLKKQLQ